MENCFSKENNNILQCIGNNLKNEDENMRKLFLYTILSRTQKLKQVIKKYILYLINMYCVFRNT